MALRINAASEYLSRTTSLPAATSAAGFAMCFWVQYVANNAAQPQYAVAIGNGANTDNTLGGYDPYEDDLAVRVQDSPAAGIGVQPTNGTWYWVAVTEGYATVSSGAVTWTATGTWPTGAPTNLTVGTHWADAANNWMNCRILALKIWSGAVTRAQMEAERLYYEPQYTTGVHAWYPLITESSDHSANGYDFTETGAVSWEDYTPAGMNALGGGAGESYTLGLEPASYALTGEASESWVDYGIGADGDTLALTGGSAALGNVKRLVSEGTSYSLTGEASALSTTNILAATGATVAYAGGAAGTRVARFVAAAGDSFTWTGEDIDYFLDLSLIAGGSQYLLQGQNTEFIYSPDPVSPQERTFIWVG